MDQIQERLAEEVRKYEDLYNSSLKDYKEANVNCNSWKEIARNLEMEVADCMKMWRKMRDRYVRLKKSMRDSSGGAGGKKVPALYVLLSWLEPHIRHRETSSNFKLLEQASEQQDQASCGPSQDQALCGFCQGSSGSHQLKALDASQDPASPGSAASCSTSPPRHPSPGQDSCAAEAPTTDQPICSSTPRVSLKRRRRKQDQDDDGFTEQMARLGQRRRELYYRLENDKDECERFGQTIADLLRRVPDNLQVEARRKLMSCVFEFLK